MESNMTVCDGYSQDMNMFFIYKTKLDQTPTC